MAIKIKYASLDEEFLFEEFALAPSYPESLTKLKNIFEKILRDKLSLYNVPFIRLVLSYSEKLSLTQEQQRILIFLNNADNVFELVDEVAYDYIIFQSRQLLEKWLSNKELIPPIFYKVSSFDSPVELINKNESDYPPSSSQLNNQVVEPTPDIPQLLRRENYLKVYAVSTHLPDESRNYAYLSCKTTQGETKTILLYEPWNEFCSSEYITQGSMIGFYNLRYGNKENFFICDKNTLMIISPDLLFDVSDIKGSVSHINDYSVSRLVSKQGPPNKNKVIGTIVNKILDSLLLGDEEYSSAFLKKEINKSKFDLALAGATVKDVYEEVKSHVENIINSGLIETVKSSDPFSVEPTFISTEFGITGRLDILYDENKIIELKTGNPKKFGVWKEDETQVTLYSLMVQNKKSAQATKATLFYSRDNENPYKDIDVVFPDSYLESMIVRNKIITFDRKLVSLSFNSFNDMLNKICNESNSTFLESLGEKLRKLKQGLDENPITNTLINYVTEFISFCERERYFEKIDFASLWTKTDYQKKEEFKLLGTLKFEKGDQKESIVEFSISTNESKIRQGDICLIYDKNEPISNQQVFKGTIKTIDKNSVTVILKNPDSIKFLNDDKQWFLEADYMDINIRKNIYALMDFATSDERTQKLILGLEQPSFTDGKLSKKISSIKNKKLTPKQKEAICNAINADDYYLIQGPPGTGKTTLLAYLIKELIADENETLLVTAFTNRAVDEMIKKFIDETGMTDSIVRLGNNDIATEYPEYMIKNLIKDIPDSKVLAYLKKKKVFFGTINTAAYNEIFPCIKFTTSIVDESSQIVEPAALSVILNTKKFVLIGDEKQLPPVVSQLSSDSSVEEITTDIKCLNEIGITRLDSSLFERLVTTAKNNNWNTYTLLDTQFRMNDKLFQFSNINFYSSELHSGEKNCDIQTEFGDDKKFINNNPIEFFDIPASGCEKNKNKNEADTLIRLLEEYYKQNEKKELGYSLGVIAPFRAQVSYILQELHARGIDDVKVDTVERFQGGERDIIFITFTAYNLFQVSNIQSLQSFGSTTVDRKLNVAVTRAKRKLVMFGNAELLGKDSIFNKLISYCKEQNCFHSPAYSS